MDIGSLIDPEDASVTRKTSGPPASTLPSQGSQDGRFDATYGQETDNGPQRFSRPSQLSTLQTPGYTVARYSQRSPYKSAPSPNQQPHFAGRNIARYPSPQQHSQSPLNALHQPQHFPQDGRPSISTPTHHNPGPSTPVTHTPTGSTPGSAGLYSSWQRPTSSHSASTPTSAQYASQNFLFESSQTSNGHSSSLPHLMSTHQISPQSSAPLGPPSTRPRPTDVRRHSPGSNVHKRNLSEELRDQRGLDGQSSSVFRSPSANGLSPTQTCGYHEREKSISISPKTRLASLPLPEPTTHTDDGSRSGQTLSRDSKDGDGGRGVLEFPHSDGNGVRPLPPRSTSLCIQGLLNDEPQLQVEDRSGHQGFQESEKKLTGSSPDNIMPSSHLSLNRQTSQISSSGPSMTTVHQHSVHLQNFNDRNSLTQQHSTTTRPSHQSFMPETERLHHSGISSEVAQDGPSLSTITERALPEALADSQVMETSPSSNKPTPVAQPSGFASAPALPSQPAKKKPRLNNKKTSQSIDKRETVPPSNKLDSAPRQKAKKPPRVPTPIFAQSIRTFEPSRTSNKIRPMQGRGGSTDAVRQHQLNGHPPSNSAPIPTPQRSQSEKGPLGYWEPSILNIIPTDEVVKVVSDFLFTQVLVNDSIGVAPAGSSAGRGAVLEIEAKIGRIIDKNTMDRLHLPVMTETVLNRNDPNMRTNFESSMTEAQHRALNGFLNKALIATQAAKPTAQSPIPPPNDRVRMDYKHTRETDTFFDLSQSGIFALPQSLTSVTNHPRSGAKTKVRITHDQKTGKELAKIVKARIADLDIYSPQNQADWRISVNVEMDFQGDMRDLIELDKRDGKRADRSKDRMSYRHQAYQIDLTQVTAAEAIPASHKEHELEIEVSSEEVRRQATLLQKGEINQFADLIRGFVDNIRTLARQVPIDSHPV